MLGKECEPRLGALALGDVHQRQQHCRLVVVDQLARIDRKIDQRSVRLDMLPRPRSLLVARSIAGPWQFTVEGLQMADGELFKILTAVAVMLDRGGVDADDALIIER